MHWKKSHDSFKFIAIILTTNEFKKKWAFIIIRIIEIREKFFYKQRKKYERWVIFYTYTWRWCK